MAEHDAGRALEVARRLEELRARRPCAKPFAELLHVQREGQRVADDRRVEGREPADVVERAWTRRRPPTRRPARAASRKCVPSAMAADMLDGNRAAREPSGRRRSSLPAAAAAAPSAVARSTTRASSGCTATMRSTSPSGLCSPDATELHPPSSNVDESYRIGLSASATRRTVGTHGVAQRDEQEGDPRGHERAPRRDDRAEAVDRGDRQARRRREDDDLPLVAEQGRGRHRRVRRAPPRPHADPRRRPGARGPRASISRRSSSSTPVRRADSSLRSSPRASTTSRRCTSSASASGTAGAPRRAPSSSAGSREG